MSSPLPALHLTRSGICPYAPRGTRWDWRALLPQAPGHPTDSGLHTCALNGVSRAERLHRCHERTHSSGHLHAAPPNEPLFRIWTPERLPVRKGGMKAAKLQALQTVRKARGLGRDAADRQASARRSATSSPLTPPVKRRSSTQRRERQGRVRLARRSGGRARFCKRLNRPDSVDVPGRRSLRRESEGFGRIHRPPHSGRIGREQAGQNGPRRSRPTVV